MNNERRKDLLSLAKQLEDDISIDSISMCLSDLDNILEEEQEYNFNIPESLQYSTKSNISDAAIDNMQEAFDFLESAIGAKDDEKRKDLISKSIVCIKKAGEK